MKRLIVCLVLVASTASFAQNGNVNEEKTSKFSIYWHPGINWVSESSISQGLGDHLPYLPSSVMEVKMDTYGGNSKYVSGNYTLLNFGIQYDLGSLLINSDKHSFRLRTGINSVGSVGSYRNQQNIKQVFIDSTYSEAYNFTLQRDSLFVTEYTSRISTKEIRWQTELIHAYTIRPRLAIYYGLGFSLSVIYDRSISFTTNYREEVRNSATPGQNLNDQVYADFYYVGSSESNEPLTSNTEENDLVNQIGFVGYVPLGIEFKLGKTNPFWTRMHVYYEGQLGVKFAEDGYDDWQNNFSMNNGFGLRFDI